MINISQYVDIFIEQQLDVVIVENFKFYELKCCCKKENIKKVSIDILPKWVELEDKLRITITTGEGYSIESQNNFQNESFYEEWNAIEDNDSVNIEFIITKNESSSVLNVYNCAIFSQYFKDLSFKEQIEILNIRLNSNQKFYILSKDFAADFNTNKIHFIKSASKINTSAKSDDNDKSEKIQSVSRFIGIGNNKLIPEDLLIVQQDIADKKVLAIFNHLSMVLLLSVIYDYAFIDSNSLEIKLNGYKNFNFSIDLNNLDLSSFIEYKNIYQWVFENQNINDKIGIARNLISLNFRNENEYTINESCFQSILSGFKIYEKQNVKQYIEIRNKMSDQIISYNEKATKIIENFASNFQKSMLGFISLFSTIVITRVLTTHDFQNIFTKDALVITLIFLFASLIYMFISLWEVNAQKHRYVKSYENMKIRNLDMLTASDIQKILNDDNEYNNDIKFIKKKRMLYLFLWFITLVIFFIASLSLRSNMINKGSSKNITNIDSVKSVAPKIDSSKADANKSNISRKDTATQ